MPEANYRQFLKWLSETKCLTDLLSPPTIQAPTMPVTSFAPVVLDGEVIPRLPVVSPHQRPAVAAPPDALTPPRDQVKPRQEREPAPKRDTPEFEAWKAAKVASGTWKDKTPERKEKKAPVQQPKVPTVVTPSEVPRAVRPDATLKGVRNKPAPKSREPLHRDQKMSESEMTAYMAETARKAKISNDQYLASLVKPPVQPKPCTVADPAKKAGKVEEPSKMKPRIDEFTSHDNAVKASPVPVLKASPLMAFDFSNTGFHFGPSSGSLSSGVAVAHSMPLMAQNGGAVASPVPTETLSTPTETDAAFSTSSSSPDTFHFGLGN
jgi:hypothetical protein